MQKLTLGKLSLGAEGRADWRRYLVPKEGAEETLRGTTTTLPREEVADTESC